MKRRDFLKLVSVGIVVLLLPAKMSAGKSPGKSEGEPRSRFDIFPIEDTSKEPSRRKARRILKFPVKSVEIIAPENPPWERMVVLAKV